MSPEFGSTAAMFPIDDVTLDYLRLTGRSDEQVALVEAYSKLQTLWHDPAVEPVFSEYLELDLATVVPSIAGPKRPQDRVELSNAKSQFELDLNDYASTDHSHVDAAVEGTFPASDPIGLTPQDEESRPRALAHEPREPRAGDLEAVEGHARRRLELHARPRRRRDRGDHVVHEHVEPVGHARRRPARPQREQEGPQGQAVGQDHARSRLEGRHRLLREGRPHRATSRTSASTRSATAARPASATPVR